MAEKRKNRKKLYKDYQVRIATLEKGIADLERKVYGKAKTGFQAHRWKLKKYRGRGRDKETGLTPMMERFIEEYPKDLNGTRAAIRAGFSKKSACTRASQMLQDPYVIKALKREYKKIQRRNHIEQDQVLKELSLIAYSNILDFCEWKNNELKLFDSKYLSRSDAASIRKITKKETLKTTTVTLELYDKPNALMVLCRYLNILDGKGDKGKDSPEEIARRIREEILEIENSIPMEPGENDDIYIPIAHNATIQERQFGEKLNKLTDKQRKKKAA